MADPLHHLETKSPSQFSLLLDCHVKFSPFLLKVDYPERMRNEHVQNTTLFIAFASFRNKFFAYGTRLFETTNNGFLQKRNKNVQSSPQS